MPYFYAYRSSNNLAWPDGRGRYCQPVKLTMAFDLMVVEATKIEAKIAKDAPTMNDAGINRLKERTQNLRGRRRAT